MLHHLVPEQTASLEDRQKCQELLGEQRNEASLYGSKPT
jgi:hypothetical protein